MRQAIGELQVAGSCSAPSYWGITISGLSSCGKRLWNYSSQGLALRQAIWELQLAGSCFASKLLCDYNFEAIEEFQFARFSFAPSHWGIATSRLLSCRVLFCAKLRGDCNSQGEKRDRSGLRNRKIRGPEDQGTGRLEPTLPRTPDQSQP